eukprot:scaffold966_cov415-Prasinococcus_capsulatus_cf.AAC.9
MFAGDAKTKATKAATAVKSGVAKKERKVWSTVTFHRPKTLKHARNPQYPRLSAPKPQRLDHFQILKFPLTTESAMKKYVPERELTSCLCLVTVSLNPATPLCSSSASRHDGPQRGRSLP